MANISSALPKQSEYQKAWMPSTTYTTQRMRKAQQHYVHIGYLRQCKLCPLQLPATFTNPTALRKPFHKGCWPSDANNQSGLLRDLQIFVVSGDADHFPQAQKFPPLSQFLDLGFAPVVDVGEVVRQESAMMGSQIQANNQRAQLKVPLPLLEEGLQCTCPLPKTPKPQLHKPLNTLNSASANSLLSPTPLNLCETPKAQTLKPPSLSLSLSLKPLNPKTRVKSLPGLVGSLKAPCTAQGFMP